jgi:ATPase subunit of ABC transporter with duplicated ATPase domains
VGRQAASVRRSISLFWTPKVVLVPRRSVPPASTVSGIIEAIELTKEYGEKRAVNKGYVHSSPRRGHRFLGPNRSGTSTTMRLILGLDAPTAGDVRVNGKRYGLTSSETRCRPVPSPGDRRWTDSAHLKAKPAACPSWCSARD